ncbi:MAG: hypothetical protein R2739_08855 [Chitinophagales bacterium]|nr:hypothetical protein [Bacteroidota bacterium]
MKNVIFIMLCLFSINGLYAQKVAPEVAKVLKLNNAKKKPVVVDIGVEFGKRRLGCREMGICKGEIIIKNNNEPEHQLIGYGQNKLAIVVLKSKLSKEKINANFSGKEFVLDEDFTFSNAISEKFKAGADLSDKLKFKKGSHKILELENYFIILQ